MNFAFKPMLRMVLPKSFIALGAAGIVATAIVAAKETPEAMKALEEAKAAADHELTFIEKVQVLAPKYLKTAAVAVVSICCVVGGTIADAKVGSGLATLSAGAMKAYDKLKEGAEKELSKEKVQDILLKDEPVPQEPSEEGKELFWEEHYGYFWAKRSDVEHAFLMLNQRLAFNSGATLDEFFWDCGLPKNDPDVKASAHLGWSSDYLYDKTEAAFICSECDEFEKDEVTGKTVYPISWETPPIFNPWEYDPFKNFNECSTVPDAKLVEGA